MARQPMRPEPYLKHMEAYKNFIGGLNTTAPESAMEDEEVADLQNMEIGERGSLRRRTGIKNISRGWTWQDIGTKTWVDLG